jgi:AraC-like DNA-binding protein/mannose-6-phosphate isomerase-like protein (cupin superfamily)
VQFDIKKRMSTKTSETSVAALLNKMSMESVFCTHSTFSAPWAISMPPIENCMMFHLVIKGSASLVMGSLQTELVAGDFILLPKGAGHSITDGQSSLCTPLHDLPIQIVSERFERLEFGGGGQLTTMLCGAITFRHPLTLRLLGILPNQILVKNDSSVSKVIQALSDLLSNEALNAEVGSSGAISRLADLLVIAALRQYLENQKDNLIGWMGALEDKRIAKAVQLVHEFPSSHWSLDELATQVGMSRTSFAVEFKRLVGNSPIDYLTEWRMSLAFSDLQNSDASILSIAMECGYQSESAFSRAFKKITGFPPGEIRKKAQQV